MQYGGVGFVREFVETGSGLHGCKIEGMSIYLPTARAERVERAANERVLVS